MFSVNATPPDHSGDPRRRLPYSDYTTAMEYAAALEDRSTKQEGHILELEASLGGQTTLTLPTELAASAAASTAGTSTNTTELSTMRAMIQSIVS